MERLLFILALLATLGSALMAGVFYAFSSFVMPALARLPPAQGVAAMQSINAAVLTPSFLLAFLGTAAACVALAVAGLARGHAGATPWLLAGGALYLVGVIAVTVAIEVPQNDALAALDAHTAEAARYWARYLPRWTGWNHVRALGALAATAAFALALRALPR